MSAYHRVPGLSDHHVILWTPGVPVGLWRVTFLLLGQITGEFTVL